MLEKKRRDVLFVTLSPTKIEVTGFNGLDSWIHDGEEHAGGSDHKCIGGSRNNSGSHQYNLDNGAIATLG
jgi:hypothetical protein